MGQASRFTALCLLLPVPLSVGGCQGRASPPGAEAVATEQIAVVGNPGAVPFVELFVDAGSQPAPDEDSGSADDILPFTPTGMKVGSIAWRTWVYTDPGPQRTRLGYLRAGAIVDARGPLIKNDGCEEGWLRINPRGFVCLGKGATQKLEDPVLRQSEVRAQRGAASPYRYALATTPPPILYEKLPTAEQIRAVEGGDVAWSGRQWLDGMRRRGLAEAVGSVEAIPAFLADGGEVAKPWGVLRRLRNGPHTGQAAVGSGFALQRIFESGNRFWGLTTDMDIVAMDRVKLVEPSPFHGVELGPQEDLPVAFVKDRVAVRLTAADDGSFVQDGSYLWRDGIKLTGERRTGGFLQTRDGHWVVESAVLLLERRTEFPSFATGERKWVDVALRGQSLVAYIGRRAVFATLVSAGRGGLGDPEEVPATVRGTFMVHTKHVSSTMDGEDDISDSYSLRDVPFVQYFHKGYALHGAYWHNEFGEERSHGCINLSPRDSAWLFEWTDPPVPAEWHSVINKKRGTVVHIHP
jgi:hypothetical protein